MRSSLSSVEAGLPPGFRFHPKDEELICDYLMRWIDSSPLPFPFIVQVDLNKCEPWDIPETACVGGKEWYFYSQRDRKYATGVRTNRATISGYWKATGKDRAISHKGALVGMRKTLVFYQGRAPKGRKTEWVMHEFRLHGPGPKPSHPLKEDWVLCRVFYKNQREIPSKQGAAAMGQEVATTPSCPSLPGLLDQVYTVPFDNHHEQVSCFSIFSQTTPNFTHQLDPHQMLVHPGPSRYGFEDYVNPTASNSSCNVNNNNSFGEAGSCDSFLSEVGLSYSSSLWMNFHS